MFRRLVKSAFGQRLLGLMARGVITFVIWTTRWRIDGSVEGRAVAFGPDIIIGAFWHNRLMLIGRTWPQGKPLGMVMSEHGDSRVLGAAYGKFVTRPIYGSTRKNATAALKGMVRALREGVSVGITPDGPRGPRMRCHPGIVEAARITGCPIIPAGWSTRNRLVAGSWDRFIIALPFGRGVVIYGDPIRVPRKLDEDERQALLEQVEISITAATDQADRMMGHVPIPPADRRAMASESAS
jgi:lysophospholipid acyltransferase (LPLAT)-like uncharacterized protein